MTWTGCKLGTFCLLMTVSEMEESNAWIVIGGSEFIANGY